jgi:hypothetical protein
MILNLSLPTFSTSDVFNSKESDSSLVSLLSNSPFEDIQSGTKSIQRSYRTSTTRTSPREQELFEQPYFITMKSFVERNWNVGKVSFILLVLFSMTDLLLNLVDAQMDTLTAFDDYDALSSEVIRPAFRYRSTNVRKANRPKLGLGSAAISSVTEALSPILPFTGGVDLRREDYWTNGIFGSFSSVMEQVRDAFANTDDSSTVSYLSVPRGGTKMEESAKKKQKSKAKKSQHAFALSSPEPFVPLKEIAELTLRDVAMAFRFAIESTRKDFNKNKFVSSAAPRLKKVFEKMTIAAANSRGKDINVPTTGSELIWGDIDALHFCAAMRIFAEWRVLRQVPDGYKGYAVGMSLGQKDIIQNVAKIEQAIHSLIDHRERLLEESTDYEENRYEEIYSPTLRELLQYEVDTKIHGNKLPRLKEKSGAMGLLWVRRQLHYQTELFSNVIKVPQRFESTVAAVSAAYAEVYDKYHGWTVQKIFNYSFQAAPDTNVIYRFMNPQRLKEVEENARTEFLGTEKLNRRRSDDRGNQDGNLFGKVGRHLGSEWGKLTRSIVHVFDKSAEEQIEYVRRGTNDVELSLQENIDDFINREMKSDAHAQILEYLDVAEPLLLDLARLFDDFNMDDPTKV